MMTNYEMEYIFNKFYSYIHMLYIHAHLLYVYKLFSTKNLVLPVLLAKDVSNLTSKFNCICSLFS